MRATYALWDGINSASGKSGCRRNNVERKANFFLVVFRRIPIILYKWFVFGETSQGELFAFMDSWEKRISYGRNHPNHTLIQQGERK
jgi:hypothetical protein